MRGYHPTPAHKMQSKTQKQSTQNYLNLSKILAGKNINHQFQPEMNGGFINLVGSPKSKASVWKKTSGTKVRNLSNYVSSQSDNHASS